MTFLPPGPVANLALLILGLTFTYCDQHEQGALRMAAALLLNPQIYTRPSEKAVQDMIENSKEFKEARKEWQRYLELHASDLADPKAEEPKLRKPAEIERPGMP
jgi:hypothetical protein